MEHSILYILVIFVQEFYNMSFDATNQKVAYVGHIGVDESEWYEQVLQDYSKVG